MLCHFEHQPLEIEHWIHVGHPIFEVAEHIVSPVGGPALFCSFASSLGLEDDAMRVGGTKSIDMLSESETIPLGSVQKV